MQIETKSYKMNSPARCCGGIRLRSLLMVAEMHSELVGTRGPA